jgi:hypothetical protein
MRRKTKPYLHTEVDFAIGVTRSLPPAGRSVNRTPEDLVARRASQIASRPLRQHLLRVERVHADKHINRRHDLARTEDADQRSLDPRKQRVAAKAGDRLRSAGLEVHAVGDKRQRLVKGDPLIKAVPLASVPMV